MDTYAWVNVLQGINLQEAELMLQRVVVKAPDTAVFNYHLGALYSQQGNKAEAAVYLEKAKELAVKHGDKVIAQKVSELL